MKNIRENKGITLIALVVTIIVLLILVGVVLKLSLGNEGVINKATRARIQSALGSIKEEVVLKQMDFMAEYNRDMTLEDLYVEGKVQRSVVQEGDVYYLFYVLEPNQWQTTDGIGRGNPTSGKDIFVIDDKLNVKYIASDGQEYGDDVAQIILEDETIIRFRNAQFAEYVRKKSGAESVDKIQFSWLQNQKDLTIDEASITSLEDLVFFPNLTTLNLKNLTLDNINGVQSCTQLATFYAESCSINDYTALSNLPALKVFNILFGKNVNFDHVIDCLKTVDTLNEFRLNTTSLQNTSMARVSELTDNLTVLYLRNTNNIAKIEGLESKTNLKNINLQGNKITKIEGLENCTALTDLVLASNKITKIEGLENSTELVTLDLATNLLTDILEADKNTKLTTLKLENNPNIRPTRSEYSEEENERLDKIQEIITVRNGNITVNVEQLGLFNVYKTLNLANQNLTTLECIEGQTEVETLNLWGNNITLSDEKSQQILKSMTKLKTLELYKNPISTLEPINELKNLQSLSIGSVSNLNLAEMQDILSQVAIRTANQDAINSIVNCDAEKITKLDIRDGNYTTLPNLSKFTNLNRLYIQNNTNITDFSIISQLTSLEELYLDSVNLTGKMPNFTNLTKLRYASLTNNYLNSTDIASLTALKNNTSLVLSLSYNSIIDANCLLELEASNVGGIYLKNNVNLKEESKEALKEKFGSKVSF